jgi:hypothetical protein
MKEIKPNQLVYAKEGEGIVRAPDNSITPKEGH